MFAYVSLLLIATPIKSIYCKKKVRKHGIPNAKQISSLVKQLHLGLDELPQILGVGRMNLRGKKRSNCYGQCEHARVCESWFIDHGILCQ